MTYNGCYDRWEDSRSVLLDSTSDVVKIHSTVHETLYPNQKSLKNISNRLILSEKKRTIKIYSFP